MLFTNHESRNTKHTTYFPLPSGDSKESNPKPDQRVFHESRDTAFTAVRLAMGTNGSHHEKPPPGHCFPASGRLAILWPGHCCPVHYCSPLFSIFFGGGAPSRCPRTVRRSRWQPVVKPRVAPRAARIAPLMALCPADKERPWSILNIFDQGATQFRRDASTIECSGAFATGCRASRRAPSAASPVSLRARSAAANAQ